MTVGGTGVTVTGVTVSGSGTSLTANLVITGAATLGGRAVTVTTAAGTSNARDLHHHCTHCAGAPTLTTVSPAQGIPGARWRSR